MIGFLNCIETIKKHPLILIVLALIIVMGIPILINCLFKLPAPLDFFVAEWSVDSVLTYYGAVLTFSSTTALSVLALWQNHIIEEENKKHTALLERMEREKNFPHLIIEDVVGYGNASGITFTLKNISENIARKVLVSQFYIVDQNGNIRRNSSKKHQISYLSHSNPEEIRLFNPPIIDSTENICFNITYTDIFDEVHNCEVTGYFIHEVTIPNFVIREKLD